MTRPLYEPTIPRDVGSLDWRESQMERRPIPKATTSAFHGWAVQMSTTAVDDSNTYWSGFGMDIPNLWFDTTVIDTDSYLQVGADPAAGSYLVIPVGLGGMYTVTLRVSITADTPLISASNIRLVPSDATQSLQLDLDPDMLSTQVDTWFFYLTGLFVFTETENIVGAVDLSTLSNPALYGGDSQYYMSMMGIYHGTA